MRSLERHLEPREIPRVSDIAGARRAHLKRDRIEASCHIDALRPLSEALERRVVGQEKAADSDQLGRHCHTCLCDLSTLMGLDGTLEEILSQARRNPFEVLGLADMPNPTVDSNSTVLARRSLQSTARRGQRC